MNAACIELIERTEEYHDRSEEGESEELGGLVHKRVIRIVLRIHLRTERHTGNYVHCEAAETPAKQTCFILLRALKLSDEQMRTHMLKETRTCGC